MVAHTALTIAAAALGITLIYCAATFTDAVSLTLRHAQHATGGLSVSAHRLDFHFDAQQGVPDAASPPPQILPKPHQIAAHPAERRRQHR